MIGRVVLDASALIALIYSEKGADLVQKFLPKAEISAVNLSEVVSYLAKKGVPVPDITETLTSLALSVSPFDETQAMLAGLLIERTKDKGLSLGDRACLALALQNNIPAITADRAWASLRLEIKVILVR